MLTTRVSIEMTSKCYVLDWTYHIFNPNDPDENIPWILCLCLMILCHSSFIWIMTARLHTSVSIVLQPILAPRSPKSCSVIVTPSLTDRFYWLNPYSCALKGSVWFRLMVWAVNCTDCNPHSTCRVGNSVVGVIGMDWRRDECCIVVVEWLSCSWNSKFRLSPWNRVSLFTFTIHFAPYY